MEAEFKMTAWDGIFAGIAAGNYDVIASAVTITPERQRVFAFTVPYYDVRQIVVLRKGDSASGFADLAGKVIGGQIGTTGIFVAQKSGVKMTKQELQRQIEKLEKSMREAARMMEYEYAAVLRDEIIRLRGEVNQVK